MIFDVKNVKYELLETFQKTKDVKSFKYEKSFEFQGNVYLKVAVYGLKVGQRAQYTIKIEKPEKNLPKWMKKLEIEVKGSSAFLEADIEPNPKSIIEYLNYVLGYLDLIKALTVIPSDCGVIRTLELYFTRVNGEYSEKTVKIPLR